MAEDNQEEGSEPTQSEEAPKPRRRRTTRKTAAKKGEEGTPEQVFASDNERTQSFLGRYGALLN